MRPQINFRFPEIPLDDHPDSPGISIPVSSLYEGRIAIVRTRGGMRWTPMLRLTRATKAYGEVVWS